MKRIFEFRDGSSAKFWEITLEDSTVITRYGKIGSVGNNAHKTFPDAASAKKEFEKLVKDKTKKGYLELGTDNPVQAIQAVASVGTTTYLEHADLNEFFEVNENNNHLRIRRGKISQPCLEYHAKYKTKGRENYERLIKEWKKKGFKVTKPNTPILAGSIADELIAAEIEDHPVYSRIFELGWGEELRGQQKRIFVFKNGLNWIGDLEFEEMVDMDLTTGVIIEGDVNVSGVLSQLTYTYPNPILVTGNVTAQSLGHKDSHMRIDGDLRVENIVYGEYNDGNFEIGGDVHGKAWISGDHSMSANGTYFLPSFHDEYDGLSPKVLDFEGGLDWDALREFIWANKNPLRKGFEFIAPEPKVRSGPASLIEQKIARGEQVESFIESDHAIQVLVRMMTGKTGGRRTLKLLENPPSEDLIRCHSNILLVNALLENKRVPGTYLAVLERLIELGCDPRFPRKDELLIDDSLLTDQEDVVKLMQRLLADKPVWTVQSNEKTSPNQSELLRRILELAAAEKIEEMTQFLETWPERTDEWRAFVGQRLEAPSSTPEQRARLRKLLENQPWEPPANGHVSEEHEAHPEMVKIFDLMLNGEVQEALIFLRRLADDSGRELLNLHSFYLLKAAEVFAGLSGTPDEYVDFFGALLKHGCDPFKDLGYTNIYVSLERSESEVAKKFLEVIEKEIPYSPGEEITHQHSTLEGKTQPKSEGALGSEARSALEQVKKLNQQAHKQQAKNPLKAFGLFEQALEQAQLWSEGHADDFSFDTLFALQGQLWCVNEMVMNQPEREPEAISLANRVLEFTQKHFDMYYSEMGALSRSAQTLAHNTLAWYALETGTGLEAALEHINEAIGELDYHSDAATYTVVLETKTKILFALERHDDAYACVYRMHRQFPDLPYFKALALTPEYQRWSAEN